MSASSVEKQAIFLMALCACLWSIAGIFIKLIPWNPVAIAGCRSLFAAFVLVIYMHHKKLKWKLNHQSITNGFFLMATFFCFVIANKLTTSANAIVLQFTAPVFILLISSIFLKQKFHPGDIGVVIMTLAGISLFFFDQLSPSGMIGNIIAVCAGFAMAVMFVLSGSSKDDECRMSGILLGHVFTAIIGVPMLFLIPSAITPTAAVSIVILGIVQLGIPYTLFGIAAKNCPPLMCSILGAIEPLLNPVWVFLFTGEKPGIFALIGAIIVIITITIWCIWRDKAILETKNEQAK